MPNRNKGGVNSYARQHFNAVNLANISLPSQVKCDLCKKNKHLTNYSEKQLNDARERISRYGINSSFKLRCRACVGQSRTELQCTSCHIWKGLDEYSKTQRKNPDSAICMKCMEQNLAADAPDEEKYEPNHDYVGADEEVSCSEVETLAGSNTTLSHSVRKILSEGSASETSSDTGGEYSPFDSEDGGVSLYDFGDNLPDILKNALKPWERLSSTASEASEEPGKLTAKNLRAKDGAWDSRRKRAFDGETVISDSQDTLLNILTECNPEFGWSGTRKNPTFARIPAYKPSPPKESEPTDNENDAEDSSDDDDDDDWENQHGYEDESDSEEESDSEDGEEEA